MNGVFLDSVGLVALWNQRDQWHTAAERAFAVLVAEHVRFFTTSYVVAECANALARVPARHQLADLVGALEGSGTLLLPSDAEWHEAWKLYVQGPLGSPGVVDLLSFAAMRRLGLRRAFTNDRHFGTAGFEPLF